MTAKVEAPNAAAAHPNFLFRAMGEPAAQARRNRKQQRLREHHLGVKVKPAPGGGIPGARPLADSAVAVTPTLAPTANTAVTLIADKALSGDATNNETSTVCEPSVAVRGAEVLLTGNWFSCFSKNGGANFQYVNPYTTFPAVNGGFCCDQIAIYDKRNDLMCWALQYVQDSNTNTLRLAVATGAEITNEQWVYYDFRPNTINSSWTNQWFDFPDMALGDNYLYVTSNVFDMSNNFKQSVVLRLPLAKLAAHQGFDYNYHSDDGFAPRVAQGTGDIAYWALHRDLGTLRVYTWPESGTTVTSNDVTIQAWSDASRTAPGPDGRDWLGREDGRITAAWRTGDTIGFGWSAAQDTNFHFPYVRVTILDRNNKNIVAQPHIWNATFAFAYPAASPNSDGKVGIAIHYGGGTIYPSHSVGVYDATNQRWQLVSTVSGRYGPDDGKWGDYQAVRMHGVQTNVWAATGFTLQSSPNQAGVEVRFILFRQ
jgi:hypothetical protein